MKWKIFITAFISALAISFPANIIGCGPEPSPYDYYISFFHHEFPEGNSYKPFYYTNYNFLYSTEEPVNPTDSLSKEWAAYCGMPVTARDATEFILEKSPGYVDSVYDKIATKKRLKNVRRFQGNEMEKYFLRSKDVEALRYILYAKNTERYTRGNDWEALVRDSVAMDALIKQGIGFYQAAAKDFIKLKYGYQVVRLAHYSRRYDDAIFFYNQYVANNSVKSVLQPMSVALKAGALYHTGNFKEAAYLFSRAFSESEVNRVSNYMGFKWCTNDGEDRDSYLSFCKNGAERSAMLTLFSLGNTGDQVANMREIYRENPGNNVLEVLAVREINKLEESLFTPDLYNRKGGIHLYMNWYREQAYDSLSVEKQRAKTLALFLDSVAKNRSVPNPGLFEIAAAYAYLMINDYTNADRCLKAAQQMRLTPKLKDQLQMTALLLLVNSKDHIDAAFEEEILGSLKWLQTKANQTTSETNDYRAVGEWKLFYRSLSGQVLAKKYHAQNELYKEALVVAAAEMISDGGNYFSTMFFHNTLVSKDVVQLFTLFDKKNKTAFESYLLNFNAITKKDVIDFAGTVYLREYNFKAAVDWFKKSVDTSSVSVPNNPFTDLLFDQVEALPNEHPTTKLAFATEMLRLKNLATTDKNKAAGYYYKMATGMYNMTYYGHAWQLVQYNRSGNEFSSLSYESNDNFFGTATAFQKEYYGCFKAHQYFKNAMNASTDKNFKARCLFMMAKCAQKQVQHDYSKFVTNQYFPGFVKQYDKTAFYQEAFNSCSYLRDFVEKNRKGQK